MGNDQGSRDRAEHHADPMPVRAVSRVTRVDWIHDVDLDRFIVGGA